MFELLSNMQSVPVAPDSITMIQRGMNKVRVSVGDHISEPSEVYIITGLSNGKLETYIIFFMIEPGIPVVYGYVQNPYNTTQREQVTEEAITFVEEMESILEEVPWATMNSDERDSWIKRETLYSVSPVEDLIEIEELEALEVTDDEDDMTTGDELESGDVLDAGEEIIEVSDDEVQSVLLDDAGEEDLDDSVEPGGEITEEDLESMPDEGKDVDLDRAKKQENVVVADGDFDELLKQAFLKPDLAEKTKRREYPEDDTSPGEEESFPDESSDSEGYDTAFEKEAQEPAGEKTSDIDEGLDIPGPSEAENEVEVDSSSEEEPFYVVEASRKSTEGILSEGDTRLRIIKFLSRF